MNNLDKQYQTLLNDILKSGNKKSDRTGTGTLSVFGKQIRHKMSEGFPLLTTKKMYFKGIVTELLWFLKGDTNIEYLVNNDCHIWDGDAYKNYCKYTSLNSCEWNEWMRNNGDGTLSMYTKTEFIDKIKIDKKFAKKWGELGRVYGAQWRKWSNPILCPTNINKDGSDCGEYSLEYIDQISNLINKLKTNPNDRRMMVTAWNPSEVDNVVLPPCHYGFQCYSRELTIEEKEWELEKTNCINDIENDRMIYGDNWEKYIDEQYDSIESTQGIKLPRRALSLMYNARSQDVPLGTPFNIASYALLLSILAKLTNMIPDELITNMGDCHIYVNQINAINEQLIKEPYELPKLIISNTINFNDGIDEFLNSCVIGDFQLENYKSHPTLKIPLSN